MNKKDLLRQQTVPKIKEGTVIDHIPAKSTFKVLQILHLSDELITFGNNLESKQLGKKGVVKIADKLLSKKELNKIALVAAEATVSVIKDYKVYDKFRVETPKRFVNIVKCINPNCITRHQEVSTHFDVVSNEPLKLRCHYCETAFGSENINLL